MTSRCRARRSDDADAVVARGEMWLTCARRTRHLFPGDTFTLDRGQPHAERYSAEGATYIARLTKGLADLT